MHLPHLYGAGGERRYTVYCSREKSGDWRVEKEDIGEGKEEVQRGFFRFLFD
jgi:hypothetical protein